jgi:hypothetical protein
MVLNDELGVMNDELLYPKIKTKKNLNLPNPFKKVTRLLNIGFNLLLDIE